MHIKKTASQANLPVGQIKFELILNCDLRGLGFGEGGRWVDGG